MRVNKKFIALVTIFILSIIFLSFSSVQSKSNMSMEFPSSPIEPTLYQQSESNWCGPGSAQSAIQWNLQYNQGNPVSTVVPIIPRKTLWAFMRDNTCSDISNAGRDNALPGNVGDGNNDVRKMNIAYDFGVDPHALAWTMWRKTPSLYFYHYWIYYNSANEATKSLLFTVEKYHEPVMAAVYSGSHWVLVIGYDADGPATDFLGNIYRIRIADPLDGQKKWVNYEDWINNWFTRYTNSMDPDPSTGWYVPPPDHWKNHWVTVERDGYSSKNADWAMSLGKVVPPYPEPFLPIITR